MEMAVFVMVVAFLDLLSQIIVVRLGMFSVPPKSGMPALLGALCQLEEASLEWLSLLCLSDCFL